MGDESQRPEQASLWTEKITMEKKVSIIVSTYNRAEKFLPRAIRSALDQTHQNVEVIVVDDCSTDNTKETVASFSKEDARVKYFCLEKNFGKDTRPKNRGILESSGEYICYLVDDCEFLPDHVKRLVEALEEGDADVAYCQMLLRDEANPSAEFSLGISHAPDAQFLLKRNYIDTSMALHKREEVFSVGGWDETLPRFVDWNLFVRMAKHGAKFVQVAEPLVIYAVHSGSHSQKCPVRTWNEPGIGIMFVPTFDPAGCPVYLPYLGDDRTREKEPRVAIFTLSYNRKEYTERIAKTIFETSGYDFVWFIVEQGSKDGSREVVESLVESSDRIHAILLEENVGITNGSNQAIDKILASSEYDIIIKIDNDTTFLTKNWLSSVVDLWKRNHQLYISPYVEGLVQNPGGAQRIGYAFIGPYLVEVTHHIGGIFAAISAKAYETFRWKDQFLHGNQDAEASLAFRKLRYMPMYLPLHRIGHDTAGQHEKNPLYFERRIKEKTIVYGSKEHKELYQNTGDKGEGEKCKAGE